MPMMAVSRMPISPFAQSAFFKVHPTAFFSPLPKRLPTMGVRPYEKPVAKMMTRLNILFTKLAAAKSSVL